MKAKFAALALALGMGVTGIAATVQAADPEEQACTHEHCTFKKSGTHAEFYDRQRHICFTVEDYYCYDCNNEISITVKSWYEDHDYEQIYYEDGSGLTYCTGCDDYYYF